MIETTIHTAAEGQTTPLNDHCNLKLCPNLMTEDELIKFLRIPQISKAKNYHNVIAHLKRYRNLPCIHLCRQPLYPVQAILDWIEQKTQKEMYR